jgi:DNA polymerase-3 subunit delta
MSVAARLVLGDDEFLGARAVSTVVDAARETDAEAVVEELTAGEMTVGDLMAAVSPALFGGQRIVVIRAGQDARKELVTEILRYLASPEPDVSLVVLHAGGAKGRALAEGLREAGAAVVTVDRPKGADRYAFVRDEFRRLGARCTEDVARMLVDAVGSGTRELAAACQQLVADAGGRVEAADVTRYYRGRAEVTGYTVADKVMAGNLAGALEALRWALLAGVDPVPIADALADGVRTVARVAAAGRGDPYQLAGGLGLQGWKVKNAQAWVAGWSPEALVQAMQVIGACNVDVRGGVEDRGYALERAVTHLVALRASTGGAGGTAAGRA